MQRRARDRWASTAMIVGVAAATACSSGGTAKKAPEDPTTDDGGFVVPPGTVTDGGSTPTGDGSAQPDADAGGKNPLGSLTVTDVADVDCLEAGGTAIEATAADPNGPLFDGLGHAGGSFFAVSSDGLRLVAFDTSGARSAPVADVIGAAGEPSAIAALTKVGNALSLQRYTPGTAVALGSSVALSTQNDWQTIAAGPTKTLAAWSHGAAIDGKLFPSGGSTPVDVHFGADAAGDGTFTIVAAPSGDGFVVAWTRTRTDKRTETLWQRVDGNGTLSAQASVILSTGQHTVVGIAGLAGGGSALLVNEGLPAADVVVLRLDGNGALAGSALRLLGTSRGFGVTTDAVTSGEIGVAAVRKNRAAFRALDATGAVAPWVCLDDNTTSSATFYPTAAIEAGADGYRHLVRAQNGASLYRVTSKTGNNQTD